MQLLPHTKHWLVYLRLLVGSFVTLSFSSPPNLMYSKERITVKLPNRTYLLLGFYTSLIMCFLCKCSCILIRYLSSKLLGWGCGGGSGVCRAGRTEAPRGRRQCPSVPWVTDRVALNMQPHTNTHTRLLIPTVLLTLINKSDYDVYKPCVL